MDVDLTEDQQLFVETTRKFLESECPILEVRRLADSEHGFERAYWRQAAALGWTAALVPEDDGGGSVSGGGLKDLVLVAEEMGRLVSPGPLVPVNVVADAIARRGTDAQKAAHLADLVAGDAIATWAWAEGDGSDPAAVTLRAERSAAGWSLEGSKTLVEAASVADLFLVTARTEEGVTQFLVPADADGLVVTPLGGLDFTRRFGRVDFSGVAVGPADLLGGDGGAAPDVERQLQVALALQNAETVGATAEVLRFTIQYGQDRIAFGKPIGAYQALKHRFADMRTWLEACQATAVASAAAVADDEADAAELISIAKSYIADRCPAIVQDCIQLHGGIGVTWEHDLHLYLRRVAQNAPLYGDVSYHRERVARELGFGEEEAS